MRIFVLLYIFLLLSSQALAYVEEDNVGLTEMTAGEQNTNMYKLKSRNDYLVKKLKKIDEFSNRNGDKDVQFNVTDIKDISVMEQKDFDDRQNKKILEEIIKVTADSQVLKTNVKPEVYFSLISFKGVKDTQVAALLQKQLSGGNR